MLINMLLLASTFAGSELVAAGTEDDYAKQIGQWRAQRVERLQAANGWLSLIGLDWLKSGANTIGSAKDNDIVIAKAPARLGTVNWTDGRITIEFDPKAGAMVDGKLVESAELLDDSTPKPNVVTFGTVSFNVIDRGGRKGLRIRDSAAETRTKFLGIDNYAVDPGWRVEAKWIAFDPPQTLDIPNVLGTIDAMPVPGKAVFERDGKTWELRPVLETPDATQLFFIFADKTSGRETYGAGRFLYAGMPADGKVVIDFNKAYNPPCAFTAYATCPLAPPENRLPFAVVAGEKKYRGSDH